MAFPEKDIATLAKLLHRVALFCGDADNRGYWAEKLERRAFDVTLKRTVKDESCPAFIRNIAEQAQQVSREQVRQDIQKVPQECEEGVQIVRAGASEDDVAAFKEFVMQLALKVADANWETEKGEIGGTEAIWSIVILGPLSLIGRILFSIGLFREGFLDVLRNSNALFRKLNKSVERVSYNEDRAIGEIAKALRADVREHEEHEKITAG